MTMSMYESSGLDQCHVDIVHDLVGELELVATGFACAFSA